MTDAEIMKAAKEAFSKYAAMDAPTLPEDAMSAFQVALARWQVRNFGLQEDHRQVLGVGEELGELADAMLLLIGMTKSFGKLSHALLKSEQKIRGMDDHNAYQVTAADAVADMMVFGIQFLTALRIDWWTQLRLTGEKVMARDFTKDSKTGGER